MQYLTLIAFVTLGALLSGCTTTSKAPSALTAVAAVPQPLNYEAKAQAALRASLNDPFSARDYRIGPLFNTGDRYPFNKNKWAACMTIYAKNSYGAYLQGTYAAFFENGEVSSVQGGTGPIYEETCNQTTPRPWT